MYISARLSCLAHVNPQHRPLAYAEFGGQTKCPSYEPETAAKNSKWTLEAVSMTHPIGSETDCSFAEILSSRNDTLSLTQREAKSRAPSYSFSWRHDRRRSIETCALGSDYCRKHKHSANPSSKHRQGDGINEKLESRPAKIAPPRFPKEARDSPIPRCAMQTRLSDEPDA